MGSSSDNESNEGNEDDGSTSYVASPDTETEDDKVTVSAELIKDLSIMTTTNSNIRLAIEDPIAI
eukprot:10186264-Ditylum_brightwellii.AAC.1